MGKYDCIFTYILVFPKILFLKGVPRHLLKTVNSSGSKADRVEDEQILWKQSKSYSSSTDSAMLPQDLLVFHWNYLASTGIGGF